VLARVINLSQRLRLYLSDWRIRRAKKIVLGSPSMDMPGWLITDREVIDVTVREDFAHYWRAGTRRVFFAEHVWEHLQEQEVAKANANCFEYLKPGGRLRLAVPDGFHPDPSYIANVRPGGLGAGAEDHRVLYTYRSLAASLSAVGFDVRFLEYWDEKGCFHYWEWSDKAGRVNRSSRHDHRNQVTPLSYTSLIIDAVKPKHT
jgi:predicted SAM-dependent methyltransferase